MYLLSDNQLQELVEELRDCLNAIPHAMQPTSVMKSWTERREQLEQSWADHRTKLFEDVITSMALPAETVCVLHVVNIMTYTKLL